MVKYATTDEKYAAIKASQLKCRQKFLEERQTKEREKYRSKYPDHKVYNKNKENKETIPKTQCQHIGLRTGTNNQCTRKVTSPETLCWQHKPKPQIESENI